MTGWASPIKWPPGRTSASTPRRSRARARWNSTGKNRSCAPAGTRVGIAGQPGKSLSSSPGRSTAMASCPASASKGTTRLQYHAEPPAPGRRTKVLTGASCHLRRLCLPGPRSLAKAWVTAVNSTARTFSVARTCVLSSSRPSATSPPGSTTDWPADRLSAFPRSATSSPAPPDRDQHRNDVRYGLESRPPTDSPGSQSLCEHCRGAVRHRCARV